jgi:hypothetical protein
MRSLPIFNSNETKSWVQEIVCRNAPRFLARTHAGWAKQQARQEQEGDEHHIFLLTRMMVGSNR